MNSFRTVNSSLGDLDGASFVEQHLDIYIPYIVICSFGIVFGIVGNLLIMGSILLSPELRRNPSFMLIFNLAISDILISLLVDPFTIASILLGKMYFQKFFLFCQFIANICLFACCSSMVSMGALSVNRYWAVFFSNSYKKVFSYQRTIVYCFIVWLIGLIFTMPTLVGWVGIIYDPKSLTCIYDRFNRAFQYAFSFGCVIMASVLIAASYLHIFIHSYQIKKRTSHQSHSGLSTESLRLAQCLFMSFFLFAICWVPFSVVNIMDFDDNFAIPAHLYTVLGSHLNSALNPILYGVFNSKMRESYMIIFKKIKKINLRPRRSSQESFAKA